MEGRVGGGKVRKGNDKIFNLRKVCQEIKN